MFFALRPARAVLSDANRELVTTFQAIRDGVDDVIGRLRSFAKFHGPELFETLRSEAAGTGLPFDVAARMIYLNKACFNGLYRVNASGKFNVPFGKQQARKDGTSAPPLICDEANLRACASALSGAFIECWDFRQAIEAAEPGDFLYCDPPYLPSSKTADFSTYTPGGFGKQDHADLAAALEAAAQRGVHVLLSSADNPASRKIYRAFRKERITARRNISSKGDGRGAVGELLCRYQGTP
jgi:DNA adenine methylase